MRPLSEGQVADYLRREIALADQTGFVELVTVYQLNDSRKADPREHMGIRRASGTWKPSAKAGGGIA